jgi:hypothetical protein
MRQALDEAELPHRSAKQPYMNIDEIRAEGRHIAILHGELG